MTTSDNHREVYIDSLISKDAPLPMMYALTGMGSKKYIERRRKYGLGASMAGRPRVPTDEVADSVWNELKKIASASESFGLKQFCELYEALNEKVQLRVIWNLFYRWEKDGNLRVHRGASNEN